jgi:hypothetical protein
MRNYYPGSTGEEQTMEYGKHFYDWLLRQADRADSVGDLAAELRRSNMAPPENYDAFRSHVLEQRGGRQAYSEWLDHAWQGGPRKQ